MTTFDDRQKQLKALKDNMEKQIKANAAAPKFDSSAAATKTEEQAKAYKDAVDKKIESDYTEKEKSYEEINKLTKENAKFAQLLQVAAVNQKFEVCKVQNDFLKQHNSDLPPKEHYKIFDCNAIHCEAFNNAVTEYNTQYAGDIENKDIIAHEFACV